MNYGYSILLESAFLLLSYIFLKQEYILGEWCAAFACGLQNALSTTYSGMVVRTTHMTGICTDIGNVLGQSFRRDTKAELWRLKVLIPLLIGYAFGGVLGLGSWNLMRENSLLIPCIFMGCVGSLYLSLPWVRDAAVEAKKIVHRIPIVNEIVGGPEEDQGGLVNPTREVYQTKLATEMHAFMADIDNDQAVELLTSSK